MMSRRRNCIHGTLVNETCVCDLLWTGESCHQRDCQAGLLRDGACHCHPRHAGEFCEYQACYHKNVLYCWGLNDVQFLPCNSSAIGRHVEPDTVNNPSWYCPCGQGRRTPPPDSICVCTRGYGGEFCNIKLCELGDDCNEPIAVGPGQNPFYNNNNSPGNGPGVVVPDSVKVALVCMSMVILVALVIWLKRLCLRQRMQDQEDSISDPGTNTRIHYDRDRPMTPAQLSATLLMLQARRNCAHGWEEPSPGRSNPGRGRAGRIPSNRPAPLPTYDEANAAPPSYASVLAHGKVSVTSCKSMGRKMSTIVESEAGTAGVTDGGVAVSCPTNEAAPSAHEIISAPSQRNSVEDECLKRGTVKNHVNWRRSL